MKKNNKLFNLFITTLVFIMTTTIVTFAGQARIEFNDPKPTRGKIFDVVMKIKSEDVRLESSEVTITYDEKAIKFVSGTNGTTAEGGAGLVRIQGSGLGVKTRVLEYHMSFEAVKSGDTEIHVQDNWVKDVNDNSVNITKTGTSKVNVRPANTSSRNANLKSLQIARGELQTEFDPNVTNYNVTVNSDIDSIVIDTETEDPDAKFTEEGNSNFEIGGNNKVTITVTAPNGVTKKVYTILVNKLDTGITAGETEIITGIRLTSKEYKVKVLNLPEGDDDKFVGYERSVAYDKRSTREISAYIPINKPGVEYTYYVFYGIDQNDNKDYFVCDVETETIQRYLERPGSGNEQKLEAENLELEKQIKELESGRNILLIIAIASLVLCIILVIALIARGMGKVSKKEDDFDDEDDDEYFGAHESLIRDKRKNREEDESDDEIEELI